MVTKHRMLALLLLGCLMVTTLPLASAYSAPSPPIGLVAEPGDATITLNWTVPADNGGAIVGYNIYRAMAPGEERFYASVPGASADVYVDTGLTNGVAYYYMVAAVNDAGQGPLSAEVSGTPMGLPGKPTGVQAVMHEWTSITLNWTAPYDDGGAAITHYRVYRGTASGGEIFLANTTALSFTDTYLSLGRTYYYRIAAVTANGMGEFSDEVHLLLSYDPGSVTGLVAAPGNTVVTLTWRAPGDTGDSHISGYLVYRSTAPGQETFLCNVLGTTYTDTGLTNGRTYYYRVAASTLDAGPGPLSEEVQAVPRAVPSAPQDLQVSSSDSTIVLTWSHPADDGAAPVTYYRIYRGTAAGQEMYLGNTTELSWTDEGLTNGRTYYYKVSAVNVLGTGPMAAEVSAVPYTVPDAPTGLQGDPGLREIDLSWAIPYDGGSAITGYNVYRGTASGGQDLELVAEGVDLPYTDADLDDSTTYYYSVSAVNAAGEGARSETITVATLPAPSVPQDLTASAGDSLVILSWNAPSDTGGGNIIGYNVYRSTSRTGEYTAFRVSGTSYLDYGLANGQTFYYKVAAVIEEGEGKMSDVVAATPQARPEPPTDLQASGGDGKVVLSWTAPVNSEEAHVLGYKIFRGTSTGTEALYAVTSDTTYTDSEVLNDVTYYYMVVAVNATSDSKVSTEVSATPTAQASDLGALLGQIGPGILAVCVILAAIIIGVFLLMRRGIISFGK
jgi:fibronectin type 3 domain-containing protein